jgi:hypothetical protein
MSEHHRTRQNNAESTLSLAPYAHFGLPPVAATASSFLPERDLAPSLLPFLKVRLRLWLERVFTFSPRVLACGCVIPCLVACLIPSVPAQHSLFESVPSRLSALPFLRP